MANLNSDQDANTKERSMAKIWQSKVDSANKNTERWETDYHCTELEGYYAGIGQWEDPTNHDQYTINMCHPNMQQRLPSLYFNRPKFVIKPRPSRADDEFTQIEDRVRLREDTLNTFLDDPIVGFVNQTKLCVREAHYRFGVCEVGYDNDAAENPNKNRPMFQEDGTTPVLNSKGAQVMEPEFTMTQESMWVRRIPAKTFRFSVNSNNELHRNEWVGYYEYEYVGDIKDNKQYKNTDKIKEGKFKLKREYESPVEGDEVDIEKYKKESGMIKVWKIWSIREKKRYVWADDKRFFFIKGLPYKTLPFSILVFYDILDDPRGLPVLTNWVSPQDELNETRTMLKTHRNRAKRKWQMVEGKIRPEEIQKFKTGGDMTIIEVPMLDAIRPIEDAPLDRAVLANVPMTREDMMYVAETSSEQLGMEQAETATAATISDMNARIRLTEGRDRVGRFLADTCYNMLKLIEENMALPTWIMKNVDPQAPMAMVEAARVAANWEKIKLADKFGGLDYEVIVDVQTLSPVTEDVDRARHEKMLAMITQPAAALLLANVPSLLKRTMHLNGIRGDREIKEIQQGLLIMGMMMSASAGGNKPGTSSDPGKPGVPEAEADTGPSSLNQAKQMGTTAPV